MLQWLFKDRTVDYFLAKNGGVIHLLNYQQTRLELARYLALKLILFIFLLRFTQRRVIWTIYLRFSELSFNHSKLHKTSQCRKYLNFLQKCLYRYNLHSFMNWKWKSWASFTLKGSIKYFAADSLYWITITEYFWATHFVSVSFGHGNNKMSPAVFKNDCVTIAHCYFLSLVQEMRFSEKLCSRQKMFYKVRCRLWIRM